MDHAGPYPAGLALSTWLTRTWFRGAQGSGIPQTIATLHLENFAIIDRLLSLRVAAGKIVLTTLGLVAGGSIGREGPSVQIGAAIMHACGRWLNLSTVSMRRGLILAGAHPACRRHSTRRWPGSSLPSRN
ncbi:chloride channel protein [Komagataeibacter rhaeticus]|nr:chloride channel protein [Komagataeibacter rhaeticus]